MQVLKKNMDKRVLIVANTAYMIRQFNMNNIELLQNMGYQVEVACNFLEGNPIPHEIINKFADHLSSMKVICHQIPLVKSPLKILKNYKAYRMLIKLMASRKYEFVHCQTPMAGALARVSAYMTKTPAIYMVHGFHFHHKSGILAWILYYPIERVLSRLTNSLIVINQEDYELAKIKMKPKHLYYVPGVGIDVEALERSANLHLLSKQKIGVPDNTIIVLSVGELNKNKNHETVIQAIAQLPNEVHYVIAGDGILKGYLQSCAEQYGVVDRVHFLGFRTDIQSIYRLADVYCHPSFREGLSVAIMEAMAAGLPIVCSAIRGNEDLIQHEKNGYLLQQSSPDSYADYLNKLVSNPNRRRMFGSVNLSKIENFSVNTVNQMMGSIYLSINNN